MNTCHAKIIHIEFFREVYVSVVLHITAVVGVSESLRFRTKQEGHIL